MKIRILKLLLPYLLPRAVKWAEQHSAYIRTWGARLTSKEMALANDVGVNSVEDVRVMVVDCIPEPDDWILKLVGRHTRLFSSQTIGLSLGVGIYLRDGADFPRTMKHELRHVAQYEQAGSMYNFLHKYLSEVIEHGYANAPMEVEARG
jgi:hypothetical protein